MTTTAPEIRRVNHPSAWKAADIGGPEGLTHRIGAEHVKAFDELAAATRGMAAQDITKAVYTNKALNDLLANLRDTVLRGRGAMVLSGLDIADRPQEEFERIYWYVALALGQPIIQSANRDLIGFVRHVPTANKARGYMSDMELGPHTDFHEVLSLACVRKAKSGGESGMTSALAVHNEILDTRPDLLAALYEGFYNGAPARYGMRQHPALDRKVPVFSRVGEHVSVMTLTFMRDAAIVRGVEIPPLLNEALAYMREIAKRSDFQASFMLEPGEMMFWHNWVNFHSRTQFVDGPGQERLLLRLWIDATDDPRPAHPAVRQCGELVNEWHEQGVSPLEVVA